MTSSRPPPAILNAWRTLIEQRDPEAVCFGAICLELHTRVFPGFAPPPEPRAEARAHRRGWALARELTVPLVRAALVKLASRFPEDAEKGLTSLIRWHVDDAYAYCAQAVEWATRPPAAGLGDASAPTTFRAGASSLGARQHQPVAIVQGQAGDRSGPRLQPSALGKRASINNMCSVRLAGGGGG